MMTPKKIAALGLAATAAVTTAFSAGAKKPNILILMSDQHGSTKLGCMSDAWVKTPVMDALARDGYMFTNAYCAHPLCVPSRFSMLTGQHPADFGVRFNPNKTDLKFDMARVRRAFPTAMGNVFKNAGYQTYYAGKEHLPEPETRGKRPRSHTHYGFTTNITTAVREPISETVSDFLKTKNKDSDPFMLVVSYLNPHDICDYVDYLNYDNLSESTKKSKADKLADVAQQVEYAKTLGYPSDEFFAKHAPPLPGNFGDTTPRPAGLKGRQKKFKEDEKIWRMHRWIYNRLIEQVDTGMGRVLAALKAQGLDANTIVVYLSDHGEMSAAHGMEQKSAPYGECQKVPFIFSGPGIKKGVADNDTPTMTGIDMLPTLCELAGVAIPETLPGVSLKQTMTEGKPVTRKYIYPSSANWFQVTDGRYKYTLFETDAKGNRMLIDLKNDPSEMINLASDPSHSRIAADMKKSLLENLRQRNVAIKGNQAD